MYVLLDGFDLGVGILFPFAPDDAARDAMMASVAPVWDGNETWLVMGGIGMLTAFPLAFAIIFPALYFPVLVDAARPHLPRRRVRVPRHRQERAASAGTRAFFWGSLVATFAQGCVLGKFVLGFEVSGRQYAGSTWDWLHPFVLAVGVGLVFGYVLLGATWLVMKTEGELQEWARAKARLASFGVLAFIVAGERVDAVPARAHRRALVLLAQHAVLLAGAADHRRCSSSGCGARSARGSDVAPFLAAMGLFALCYLGLAISLFPYVVPHTLTLWDAATAPEGQAFLLIGTMFLIPVIFMYTGWSYWVFRGKVKAGAGYH